MGGYVVADRASEAVRWAAFDRLRAGRAIAVADLAADVQFGIDELGEVLGGLVAAGLLERDTDGIVVGSHGLTLRPTVHHLVLDGVALHTWCALDAVAIPAALGVDAELTTCCGWCDQSLRVTAVAGRPQGGEELRVWVPGMDCENVLEQFCPFANLFCGSDHLEQWRVGAGEPPGHACMVTEIADLGPTWWSRDPDCCTPGAGERPPW